MHDKVVFITGISRGIGKALAEKFLAEEYEVVGTSTSGKASIKHKLLTVLNLNLSLPESIEECVKVFTKLNKKIDILINNAGIYANNEDPVMKIDYLRKVLEVNLIGTIDLTERLLPFVREGGKIINISSRAGSITNVGIKKNVDYPDYRISKASLNMYTKTLSIRLEGKEIIVASIHPGWVETDMGGKGAEFKPHESAENIYNKIVNLKETGQFWFKQDK